jgi:hypothetical protein
MGVYVKGIKGRESTFTKWPGYSFESKEKFSWCGFLYKASFGSGWDRWEKVEERLCDNSIKLFDKRATLVNGAKTIKYVTEHKPEKGERTVVWKNYCKRSPYYEAFTENPEALENMMFGIPCGWLEWHGRWVMHTDLSKINNRGEHMADFVESYDAVVDGEIKRVHRTLEDVKKWFKPISETGPWKRKENNGN